MISFLIIVYTNWIVLKILMNSGHLIDMLFNIATLHANNIQLMRKRVFILDVENK